MPQHDADIVRVHGLPEKPPEGEKILWQGRPSTWALARESLSLYWVIGYFVFLALWRFVTIVDVMGVQSAAKLSAPFLFLGLIVCGLLLLFAFAQARTTVYTITNRRVAMRIGAALTVTLNLPFTQIANADLQLRRSGHGTIALDMLGSTPLSYVMCWPHVRPWYIRRMQPALRCVPDAEQVARILAEAAQARVSTPIVTRTLPADAVAAE